MEKELVEEFYHGQDEGNSKREMTIVWEDIVFYTREGERTREYRRRLIKYRMKDREREKE